MTNRYDLIHFLKSYNYCGIKLIKLSSASIYGFHTGRPVHLIKHPMDCAGRFSTSLTQRLRQLNAFHDDTKSPMTGFSDYLIYAENSV